MDPDPAEVPPGEQTVGPYRTVAHVVAPSGVDAVDRLVAAARTVLIERAPAVIVCDVGALSPAPSEWLRTVEVLVRLQLDAKRRGSAIRLTRAGTGLRRLLDLTGMNAVLPEHHLPEAPAATRTSQHGPWMGCREGAGGRDARQGAGE